MKSRTQLKSTVPFLECMS